MGDYEDGPQLIPFVEDDGYVSPEFDLPSGSEDEGVEPTSKRARHGTPTLEDEEELALRLLRGQWPPYIGYILLIFSLLRN